jgi:RNA polymerase sigma-70 factor (ECF subfamily)
MAWAGRLYDAKAAPLVLYGRALGLSHAEAEDVLHETFRALLALEAAPEQPEHYLVRSFRNRALNYRRSWWRRLARELEAARWFEPAEPEDPAEARLAAALAGLPQEQREVIVLKIWHRLTFAAIGRLQDISPHTAAGRFRYGVARLRRVLAADAEPETTDGHGWTRIPKATSQVGSATGSTASGASSPHPGHSLSHPYCNHADPCSSGEELVAVGAACADSSPPCPPWLPSGGSLLPRACRPALLDSATSRVHVADRNVRAPTALPIRVHPCPSVVSPPPPGCGSAALGASASLRGFTAELRPGGFPP